MVFELLGVKDVLAKSFGSSNPINVTKATIEAVKLLSNKADVLSIRK
jgi:ribosomal protein S5